MIMRSCVARKSAAAIGLGLLFLSPAVASARPVYFHKASVARETFIAEFFECNELAGGARAPQYQTYSPDVVANALGSVFAGFMARREKRAIVENVLRTCMTDKGYRRIEPTPELRKQLFKLPERERLEQLFTLATSPTPVGTVLPK